MVGQPSDGAACRERIRHRRGYEGVRLSYPGGTYEKIADLTESEDDLNTANFSGSYLFKGDNLDAYVDRDLNVYSVRNNTVTNVTSGKSRTWWDYELRELVKDDPIGGYPGN